jgi:hypothetical protein
MFEQGSNDTVKRKIHFECPDIPFVEEEFCRLRTDTPHKHGGTVAQCICKDVHVPFRMCCLVENQFDFAVFDKFYALVGDFVDEEIPRLSEMLINRFPIAAGYGYSVRHRN